MARLLIATNNQGKLIEISELLSDVPIELVSPAQIGLDLEVEEDGKTYQENAAKKARAFATASGLPSLADDSGLEVFTLGGLPGLHSARFAPQPGATDADRRARLLRQLSHHPRPWLAQFRCLVALALPSIDKRETPELLFAEGICPGEIIPQERGSSGFGYDPIFLIPELDRTMAELSLQEKNRLSHRARAVRAIRPELVRKLTTFS